MTSLIVSALPHTRRAVRGAWSFALGGLLACGAAPADDRCVTFQNPELESSPPSVVRVGFQLRHCNDDRPLPTLDLPDFELREDGEVVSTFESRTALVRDDRSFQQAVVVMLDLSGSMLDSLPEVKTAAKSLVDGLSRQPYVALYTFDGRASPELRADFTTDLSNIRAAIDAIPSERIDTSTNLNGAVIAGVRRLDERRVAVEAGGVLYAGALALFTDGTDRAGRWSESAALDAVRSSGASVFTIGLGSEIDSRYLRQLGASGATTVAADLDGLNEAFGEIGQAISALANSYYVLAYCSPRRAETHELSISIAGYGGAWQGSFDASGFDGGCTPEDFLRDAPPADAPAP